MISRLELNFPVTVLTLKCLLSDVTTVRPHQTFYALASQVYFIVACNAVRDQNFAVLMVENNKNRATYLFDTSCRFRKRRAGSSRESGPEVGGSLAVFPSRCNNLTFARLLSPLRGKRLLLTQRAVVCLSSQWKVKDLYSANWIYHHGNIAQWAQHYGC